MPRHLSPGILVLALAAACPAAARADCPATREDTAAGIRVAFADGSSAEYRRDAAGDVTETWITPGAGGFRVRARFGLYALDYAELAADGQPVPGRRGRYTYSRPLPAEPQPFDTFDSDVRTDIDDGGPPLQGRYVGFAASADDLVIGPCRYARLTVRAGIVEDGEQRVEVTDWLPALGFGILRLTEFPGGRDEAVPVSIARTGR